MVSSGRAAALAATGLRWLSRGEVGGKTDHSFQAACYSFLTILFFPSVIAPPPPLRPCSRIKMELSSLARAFFVPLCLSHVTPGGFSGPIWGSLPEQVRSGRLECNIINNVAFKRVELTRPELNFSTFLNLNWFHIYHEHVLVLQLGINPAMGYRFTANWITRWDQ